MDFNLLACWLLCFLAARVQSRPQITKLLPVQEIVSYHQRLNEAKPLDKLLGKLRATYNFVFNKPENTSNVERILANDAPDPDLETLKTIWSTQASAVSENRTANVETVDTSVLQKIKPLSDTKDDWLDDIQPLEPLSRLELQDEARDKVDEVEEIMPGTTLQLPTTLRRHLIDWLGSLLGLTYTVYAKLSSAIHADP